MNNNATPIRVGLVGVGNWARYGHIPALRLLPGFSITAISSRSETRASAIAADHGIPHAFSDPRTLVEHPEVDLVAVLAPAPEHAAAVRMAVAAGKAVYCEWPLTVSTADSTELLALVRRAGVRHVVGLQRTVGPSARYLRDLLSEDYVGQLRSVRMHVSVASFGSVRPPDLAWTLPAENFSHVLSIYGGHFMDMLFRAVGRPRTVGAVVATQFPLLELSGTGKTFASETPDGVMVQGTLENGALYQVQIEGGKRHNAGLQIDITGTQGDLRISNEKSFVTTHDNIIEGANSSDGTWRILPVPARYQRIPDSSLDVSVQDLAHLYASFAEGNGAGNGGAPDFSDAVVLHRVIDAIQGSSATGKTVEIGGTR
ncbi:Gfo/Idh/MocA family protein [Nevskia soli]|uniref:Gfo/Idh/MocA family protein n=1 Tax=Nevskia soli TaxID=418856 RepID=UPI00068BD2A8|nr:Gfo/Idh/MocA family oxidoreductase [Nevskia soli]